MEVLIMISPSYTASSLPSGMKPAFRDIIVAGVLTSQVAALIMAVVIMIVFTVFLGKGPLFPVQVIGSTVYSEVALQGFQLNAFLAGLILHLAVAFAWGLVFCLFTAMFDARTALRAGIIGVIVAILSMTDTYIFVPQVMMNFHEADIWNREVPIFWNWAAHIIFGASFAFYPLILAKWQNFSR
jgi:hypothetical protein